MSDREVKDLKPFLEKYLSTTVLDYTLSGLTKPGENHASILQTLEVTVADADGRVSSISSSNLVVHSPNFVIHMMT